MADFCKQCAYEMWGENVPSDFENLSTPEDTVNGLYAVVLCEGCGPCQVDHTGKCVSPTCFEKHGENINDISINSERSCLEKRS